MPLTIRMEEGPLAFDGSNAAFYRIVLQLGPNVSWSVVRRYSEFDSLRKELQTMLSPAENDLFPHKHPFSSSADSGVVEERLRQLPVWLMAISSHPTVSLHPNFRKFLDLTEHEEELKAAQQGRLGAAAPLPMSTSSATAKATPGQPTQPVQQRAAASSSSRPQQLRAASEQLPIGASAPYPQPQQLPLVETATRSSQPNIAEPAGFTASGVAEAPPAPHDESATATTQVEVRLPPVAVPEVTGRVESARKEVMQAKQEEEESRKLNERALALEKQTEELGLKASDRMREATLLREKEASLKGQATSAASEAAVLEKAAASKRSEASHYWSLSQEREEEARRKEQEGERLMQQYNEALRRAQAAKQEADLLHRDAEAKRLDATEQLERAAAEVYARETASELQGQQETVKQAAFAAAAAARAKMEIAEAAKAKAEEEALVAQAHALAKAEAEAQAELQLAQHRLMMAKAKKEETEQRAQRAERVAHDDTQLAASDAAEVDARVKAAALVAERTKEAHYLAGRAEMDWQKAENVRESILGRKEREEKGTLVVAKAAPTETVAGGSSSNVLPASALVSAGAATDETEGEGDLDALSTRSIASSTLGKGSSSLKEGQSPAVPSMPMNAFVGRPQPDAASKGDNKKRR